MSTHATQLLEHQLFSALKSQITSLATPLYGTRSEDASKVYNVVSYSMPNDTSTANNTTTTYSSNFEEETTQPSFGVAIILYTGPPTSPFTSWTLISHVDNQPDIITGANRLFQDLRRGMGGVIDVCMQTGDWTTKHGRIPNVVPGVGEVGQDMHGEVEDEEYQETQDGAEYEEDGETEDESEGLEQNGKGGWSPTLESIIEEM